MSQSLLTLKTLELVYPEHANPMGAAFGGFVMALMDKVASYAASRFARATVVTVSVSEIEFKVPINVGDLLEVEASVVSHGRTSITVDVNVSREKFGGSDGEQEVATSGRLVFVRIDESGRPTPLDQ